MTHARHLLDVKVLLVMDAWTPRRYAALHRRVVCRCAIGGTNRCDSRGEQSHQTSCVPLLDCQLIEYATSIPSSAKIRPFQPKHLFRRAFADFLPAPILTRKKMGFNVPTATWLREGQRDLIARLLLSDRVRDRDLLNSSAVAHILRDHQEGRTNYGNQIYLLASLELWFRVFIDSPDLEHPQLSTEELLEPGAQQSAAYVLAVL